MRRWIDQNATLAVVALALVDLITLAVTVVIALNQGAALDEAIARGCHNSGVLIQKTQQEIEQTNFALYRQFFPDTPAPDLREIIRGQLAQDRAQIRELSKGCTPEQLRVE